MNEKRRSVCFYHSRDLDGWTSAAIVKKKFPNVELFGWDYGDPIPEKEIEEADDIFIADICFPAPVMEEISLSGKGFIWCDHHASALDKSNDYTYGKAFGKRDPTISACELTWMECFPEEDIPDMVTLLGKYDSFRHKGTDEEKEVMMFQYAARSLASSPEEAKMFIESRDSFEVNRIMKMGESIYKYLCVEAEGIFKKAYRATLGGYDGLFVNRERFNPANFDIDYHNQGVAFFCCYWWDGVKECWTFSLYNDDKKCDVSVICGGFGGGGHSGAAGFTSSNLDMII